MRTVFVNPEQCIGCLQCEFACAVEHSQTHDQFLAHLEEPVPQRRIHVAAGAVAGTSFPNRCRHCDPAPCLEVCPTAAITRDTERDVVLIDGERCITCAMCAIVCPFDVLTFAPLSDGEHPRPVAVKCDGCVDRLARGQEPACSEACKVDALVFGELDDLVAEGRARETATVLAAVAAGVPQQRPAPDDGVTAWRAWGEAVADIDDRASDGGAR